MSLDQPYDEITAWAFAQAIAEAADSRALSIEEITAGTRSGIVDDLATWLNKRDIRTVEGEPWTAETVSSFCQESRSTLVGMAQTLMAQESVPSATQRILELWGDGIPVLAILAVLTQEGYTDSAGLQFTVESIAETIDAYDKALLPSVQDQDLSNSAENHSLHAPEPPEAYGRTTDLLNPAAHERGGADGRWVTHEELQSGLTHLGQMFRHELESMANALRDELRGLSRLSPTVTFEAMKESGVRVKIEETIDATLMRQLENECTTRQVSLSTMLDTIVRQYFDRPKR